MRKRKAPMEVIPSGDPVKRELVLEKIAELVALRLQAPQPHKDPTKMTAEESSNAVLMQPWFLPREISSAILRLLPISHQKKWTYAFEDWGCSRCERKDVLHQSLGFCRSCYVLVFNRLRSSIARHANLDGPNLKELTDNLTRKLDSAKQILGEHQVISSRKTGATRRPVAR